MQHGRAVDKSVDPERPLSGQGEEDVNCVARMLVGAGTTPDKIFHSGKARSRQTAEIFGKAFKLKSGAGEISGIAPLDSVSDFAVRIPGFAENTMVCGHQPFMGRLVSHLLAGNEDMPLVEFSPGSVACLEPGSGGSWVLCWLLRPELCAKDS